jgi:hypothetical protein
MGEQKEPLGHELSTTDWDPPACHREPRHGKVGVNTVQSGAVGRRVSDSAEKSCSLMSPKRETEPFFPSGAIAAFTAMVAAYIGLWLALYLLMAHRA